MEDDLGLPVAPLTSPPVLGGESYGEAQVVQPETSSSTITQYTTYLVKAKLGADSYSCRKRYSDFEWLRAAISRCFPGVRVPPLPKKQSAAQGLLAKTGAVGVEEAFIESRRAGLQDFLQAILRKRELCVESQILKRFLGTTSEEDLDELKKKIDSVPYSSKNKKYSEIYAAFKEANVPADDRIASTKTFLAAQTVQLRELADGFKEVVDAQHAVTKAVSGAQTKLFAVSHSESGSLQSAGVQKAARPELVEGLRKQSDALQAAPAMHYELLLTAAERELSEAEAMLEALDSVEVLQSDMQAMKQKVESLGATLQSVLDGGEIPSTGTGMARMLGIAKPKDREERIAEMKAEHELAQKQVLCMEEFHRLAHIVLTCSEIDSFFKEKVAGHRQVKDTFAGLSQRTAEYLVGAWGGVSDTCGGYAPAPAAAYNQAAELDLEYE